MKINVKYLLFAGIMAFVFGSCEKENVKPENPDNSSQPENPNNPSQGPKTYTYVYGRDGIPQDTVLAHTDVDTFYVVPEKFNLFSTSSENIIHVLKDHLENCTNLNPKTHGKGPFKTKYASVADSTWLANFGYDVQR